MGRGSGPRRGDRRAVDADPASERPSPDPRGPALGPAGVLALQRSAGNASVGRMLAREAQVELPGWGSPLFGHDDSDVTFTPRGTFETAEFAAEMSGLGDVDPLLVYYRQLEGVKARQFASSSMEERGGYGGTLPIKAGTRGTVTISVDAHFFFDEKVNDTYDQEFSCSWEVQADTTGQLTIGDPRPEITPIGDDEAPFQLQALNPSQSASGGTVQISPQFSSYQFTDVPNVSLGGGLEVGKGGKAGVEGGVTLGNEQTFPAGVLVRTFSLQLQVVDIPPPPEPEVTIESISMRRHRTHEVLFERPGQKTVSRREEADLLAWYMSLGEPTRELLREGGEKVKVDGYASTTDRAPNNRELARDRADAVMGILRDFGAKEFDDAALGEYDAMEDDPSAEVEDAARRKVVVEVVEAPVTIYPEAASP